MQARGETRSDWEAPARKPLPDGVDPDDGMEEVGWMTMEWPMRQGRLLKLMKPSPSTLRA
jgi:hypothetical protein